MGQQQLLLVILVTIIVGIATVVAINIFGTAADQANRDAVRQDLMAAGVQAQAIWARPDLMNGADRDFNELDAKTILARLNIPGTLATDSSDVENENGVYTVAIDGEDAITITGVPTSGGNNLEATVDRNETTDDWQISIAETSGGTGT
jgi:type II secretory pathway pseudopilin PulG